MQCVILAGGLGTRMRPFTEECPKSMLPVAGKPFLHYQLDQLSSEGVTDVVYCVGYLGGMIRDYVGSGNRWGIRVSYVDEGPALLGTAGALRLALDHGVLDDTFILLYGDSFTRISIRALWEQFKANSMPALMTVIRNDGKWDRSNVIFENGRVILYDKSRRDPRASAMRHIDYGISVLMADLVARMVSSGEPSDLAPILHRLSLDGRVGGFEAAERFFEIGSPRGLSEFEEYITEKQFLPRLTTVKSPPKNKIGILGGGLAGLTVAAHLGGECEVLERDDRPGGHCLSVQEEGFTYDAGGPHIMFSRNQQTLDFMISLLGNNIYRGRRNNKIFFKGRYVKYPFENGLGDLEPQDRFECLFHYINNSHPKPSNFREWMYHNFGSGITERYLLPYNEKIWNVPADQMSLDWVDGRVPKPPAEDVIKAAVGLDTEGYTHQLHFCYPARGGIESLLRGMAQMVSEITTNFVARSIRRIGGGWLVSDGQRERRYGQLVSTIPIHEMARIVEDVPDEVKNCVAKLRYNSLFTVTIGLASDRLPDYTAIYVPDPAIPFHRLSFPAVFSPTNVPSGRSLIQAEITANAGDGVWELSDSEVLRRVVMNLETMDLLRGNEICYAKVIRTEYGYVVQDFTYRQYLEKAKGYFENLGIALCGRVAEFEYINMDQCIERGIKVAARLNQKRTCEVA